MKRYNLSIVQKIALAGIFIVLVALFQKVFAVNYIPVVPFLRVSFGGPALIIFSSILLGPWFGLLVGAASDLIGFFIFDPRISSPYPMFQITFIYALLGFGSYFIFKLVNKIKSSKKIFLIEVIVFSLLFLAVTFFIIFSDSIVLYNKAQIVTKDMKIWLPIVSFILLGLLILITYLIDKHFKKRNINISTYHISFSCFLIELSIMLVFGSLMKYWAFQIYYPTPFYAIFILQLMVGMFNIPFNTFLLSYIMFLTDKIVKPREIS